jgi:hypothetical protein
MEKRDEIKESVKARMIEILAQQLVQENDFELLKKELLEELKSTVTQETEIKIDAETKTEIPKSEDSIIKDIDPKKRSIWLKELGFPYNENAVRSRLEKLGFTMSKDNFVKEKKKINETIDEVKAGKISKNLKTFPDDLSYEPDYSEVVEKMKTNPLFMTSNPIPTTIEKIKETAYAIEQNNFKNTVTNKLFPSTKSPGEENNRLDLSDFTKPKTEAVKESNSISLVVSGATNFSTILETDKPKSKKRIKPVSDKPKRKSNKR